MKNEIIIDLKNVKNENDIVYRFYKSINCFYYLNEKELVKRVAENTDRVVWDAFQDNLSGVSFLKKEGVNDLVFIITNIYDVQRNISNDVYLKLIDMLSCLTEPATRVDGLNFYFQIRQGDLDLEKEESHNRLHKGLGGKDMNN